MLAARESIPCHLPPARLGFNRQRGGRFFDLIFSPKIEDGGSIVLRLRRSKNPPSSIFEAGSMKNPGSDRNRNVVEPIETETFA